MNNQNAAINYERNYQRDAQELYLRNKKDIQEMGVENVTKNISSISEKIEKNPEYNLNDEEYFFIGNICYFIGLDMTNSRGNYLKIAVENFKKRFTDISLINENFVCEFSKLLSLVKEKNIVSAKNSVKDYLDKDIRCDSVAMNNLKVIIKQSFNTFEIPVKFSIEINNILNNRVTFQNLLMINSLIYQHVRFAKNSIKKTIELFGNQTYMDNLYEAETRAIRQRFGIMYFDSILSACELYARDNDFMTFLIDNKKFETYEYASSEKEDKNEAETQQAETNQETPAFDEKFHPTDPNVRQNFHVEHPDFFVRSVLEEYINRPIDKPEDIIEALDNILQNGEFASHLYQYLAQNKNRNREERDETWEIFEIGLKAAIADRIDAKRENYKKAVEKITEKIPDDNINRIITYVNDVITNLVIEGIDNKGHLLTQIFENQISTWKHLQEMLQIIDAQYIIGSQYDSYVILYEYLKNKTPFITEIHEAIETCNASEVEISLFTQFKQFVFPKENEGTNKN